MNVKKCEYSGTCYSQNHRRITRYLNEVSYKTERLMSLEEGIEKYKIMFKKQ